jgi:hypothetical protein
LLAGVGGFADAQGAAFAGAAGADIDAGFAQGRGDLADLAADRADVAGGGPPLRADRHRARAQSSG